MEHPEFRRHLHYKPRWIIFYKLFWIFALMSLGGYLLEVLSFFVYNGHFVNRQGMIYGPFSQIYGMAAVLLVICFHRLAHKRFILLFALCTVVSAAFEFMISLVLQNVFGVIAWSYSHSFFSLYGRTDLLNDVVWGLMGALFLKYAYPWFSDLADRTISRPGVALTWILTVFFVFDLSISAAAVARQSQRHAGVPAANAYQIFMDKNYPDSLLKEVYPKAVMK